MKFLEIRPDSDPDILLEQFVLDFIPDIFSALRNNQKFEINRDEPLSPEDIIALFMQINSVMGLVNRYCKMKYQRPAPSIKLEMRIRDNSFVWFRFVPLDEAREPITEEKENMSLVLPKDLEQISSLNKEGYNVIAIFNKSFPPKT